MKEGGRTDGPARVRHWWNGKVIQSRVDSGVRSTVTSHSMARHMPVLGRTQQNKMQQERFLLKCTSHELLDLILFSSLQRPKTIQHASIASQLYQQE